MSAGWLNYHNYPPKRKCPKCKEEIDHLVLFCREENRYKFCLDGAGDPQRLIETTVVGDDEDDDFECPTCSEVLFKDWDEAALFLKGGRG